MLIRFDKSGQVILPVLFGFLLRIKSFNKLSSMIKNHEFSKLVPRGTKLAQVDAISDTLKVIDRNRLIIGKKPVPYVLHKAEPLTIIATLMHKDGEL
ncbi:hypothetical protein E4K68_06775 [Desulfosporosinus sp. Sb-LF]|nr:hypothetical protein E4K68_06775 [Desulfosporosinus sp. Sb-LF]